MDVLITGITGFVGRHLAKELVERDYEVSGIMRYVSDRDTSDLTDTPLYYADIIDATALRSIFREVKPDIVIHLATQSSVEFSFNNPCEEYQVGFIDFLAEDTPTCRCDECEWRGYGEDRQKGVHHLMPTNLLVGN